MQNNDWIRLNLSEDSGKELVQSKVAKFINQKKIYKKMARVQDAYKEAVNVFGK